MDITHLSDVLDLVVKRLDQTQNLEDKLDHVMKCLDTVQNILENQREKQDLLEEKFSEMSTRLEQGNTKLERCIETRLEQGNTKLERCSETKLEQVNKTVDIEQINTSMTTLAEKLDTMEKNMSVIVKKIESVETSVNVVHKTVREDLLAIKQGHDQLTTKVEQSTNEVKDDISRSKREIFAVTEKEAQIVRDRIEGPLQCHGKYTFDFYLENFSTLTRSDKELLSLPWHINEMKSCVMGYVILQASGEMEVWLMYGRYPREVGLKPVPGVRLKVVATICDICDKVLPDVTVGEGTWTMNEAKIIDKSNFGYQLGVTSCDDLIQKGYGEKEGYEYGAVLIRYDVTVL